jgi:Ran GTPase-activating protein (RanGAP) involved in mRNA processing and transport
VDNVTAPIWRSYQVGAARASPVGCALHVGTLGGVQKYTPFSRPRPSVLALGLALNGGRVSKLLLRAAPARVPGTVPSLTIPPLVFTPSIPKQRASCVSHHWACLSTVSWIASPTGRMAAQETTAPRPAGGAGVPSRHPLRIHRADIMYEIASDGEKRRLSSGSFDAVYAAKWGLEAVAVKPLDVGVAPLADTDTTALWAELELLRELYHEHAVVLHGAIVEETATPPMFALVMDRAAGSLRELVHEGGDRATPGTGATPAERLRVLRKAAAAVLAFVHQGRRVHADFTPASILVDDKGGVRVADFAVAKLWREGWRSRGSLRGTYGPCAYLDPRRYEVNEPGSLTKSSVVCSLGQVVWEALEQSTCLGVEGARALAGALARAPLLTTLGLSENSIGDEGAHLLATGLAFAPLLTLLDLSRNSIGPDGARALAGALAYLPQLTTLNLGGNRVGDEGVRVLAESFAHVPLLMSLSLFDNSIGGEGASALAGALPHVPRLAALDLSHNSIGSDGARVLAGGLAHVAQLTTLKLSFNTIRAKGMRALARALTRVPQLTTLELSFNAIGVKGAPAIADALTRVPRLATLDLSGNRFGSEGALALAVALPHVPQLAALYLAGTFIGDAGTRALADAKARAPRLTIHITA